MRIALNLIGYLPGCGGVETYLLNLLAGLQQIDSDNSYLVLCDEPVAPLLQIWADNFQIRTFAYQKNSLKGLLRGALQRSIGKDILCRELAALDVDVMHHPLTVLNPPGLPFPAVLTFHDMQQEFFPHFFAAHELQQRRRTYLTSVREATVIVALSGHGKNCLVEQYGVEPAKVVAIPSGCGREFHPRSPDELTAVAAELGIERPFLFYPAATWPHKNHLQLLEAMRLLVEQHGFDGELLLTGAAKEGHGELLAAIERLQLTSRVRWLGYLQSEQIFCLFNLARLLVFPSLFEGFGLPVVEAMASGCPVACSRSSSLPEVGGDAVLYFDPEQPECIAETIGRLWQDESLRRTLREKGIVRAQGFCWEETARKMMEAYRRAAGATV